MKPLKVLCLIIFGSTGLFAQVPGFKHDWDMKYIEHGIQFTSMKRTPVTFSTTDVSQAIILAKAIHGGKCNTYFGNSQSLNLNRQ